MKKKRAMQRQKNQTSPIDWILLATTVGLLAYGLLMLYSATFYVGTNFWRQQVLWVTLGGGVILVMLYLPYPLWQRLALPLMGITLFLLLLVLLLGEQVLGAQRALIGASVQPGILARLVTVIYVAAWLSSKGEQLGQIHYGLIPFAVIIGVVAGMIALQPDLSTAILLSVTGLAMFFFAGGDPLQIFLSAVSATSAFGFLAWQFTHARTRLLSYVVSLQDPAQMPYHVHRAIVAIGSGGLFGVGIGAGQLKSGYLPFPHTDSIFAVIGEEGGLVATLLVLVLFAIFTYRGYRIALETADPFGSLLAFGATTMIVTEALLNIMVMIGLVPFTGTALPFFSYGGSEMVITMTAVGLMLNISRGYPKGDWDAILDRWGRNWRARLPRPRRDPGFAVRRS